MTRIYPGDRRLARQHLALGNYARAYELDPSLRSRKPMALDAATEEAIIERAIRTARRSSTTRSTSQARPTMPSRPYKPMTFFHRSNAAGERFAQLVAMSRNPSLRRRQVTHALDAEPDHEAALKHLEDASNHIEAVQAALQAALEAMRGGAEDEDEPDRDAEGHDIPPDSAVVGGRRYSGDRRRAKDNMGETPARSAVTTAGERRDIDHRNDFRSRAAGGADSALAYEAIKLFQRAE